MSGVTEYLAALYAYVNEYRIYGIANATASLPLDAFAVDLQVKLEESLGSPTGGPDFKNLRTIANPDLVRSEAGTSVLKREKRLVILGEPGQGKSTLSRQAIRHLMDRDSTTIPLLIELGRQRAPTNLDNGKFYWLYERMPDRLRHAVGEHNGPGWRTVCEALDTGSSSVFLDGLDELGNDAQRQLCELIPTLGENKVAVTSRPGAYRRNPLTSFECYVLQPLDSTQSEDLIATLCRVLGDGLPQGQWERLRDAVMEAASGRSWAIAGSPLLLSCMCWLACESYRQTGATQLPDRTVPLFRQFIRALVEWQLRKPQSNWPPQLTAERVSRILGPLALATFTTGTGTISEESLETATADGILTEQDRVTFFSRLLPAGFIERSSLGFTFPVEAFREYFAATAVAARRAPYEEIRNHLHDPRWHNVILYAAGGLNISKASPIALRLPRITATFVTLLSPIARLVSTLLSSLHLFSIAIRPKDSEVDQLLEPVRGRLDAWLTRSRRSTEYFLARITKARSRYESVLHRDFRLAAHCLAEVDVCTSRTARILRLQSGSVWATRRRPNEAPPMISELRFALRHEAVRELLYGLIADKGEDDGMRIFSVLVLASAVRKEQVKEYLLSLTRDVKLLVPAVMALQSATDDPRVFDRLVSLGRITDAPMQLTMSQFGFNGVRATGAVLERLIELLGDEIDLLRMVAVRALAQVVQKRQIRGRIVLLLRSRKAITRAAAVGILQAVIRERSVYRRILYAADDEDRRVRLAAAQALWFIAEQPRVKAKLLRLARDRDVGVQACAAQALGQAVVDDDVKTCLLEMSRAAVVEVRSAAALALGGAANDPRVRARLLDLSRDSEEGVRRSAVSGLVSSIDNAQVRERVIELTHDNHDYVRLMTAISLSMEFKKLRDIPEVLEMVIALSRDNREDIRSWMAAALSEATNVERARDRLVDMICDAGPAVRKATAMGLGRVAGLDDVKRALVRIVRQQAGAASEGRGFEAGEVLALDAQELLRGGVIGLRELAGLARKQIIGLSTFERFVVAKELDTSE